jgi:hypothetical protein
MRLQGVRRGNLHVGRGDWEWLKSPRYNGPTTRLILGSDVRKSRPDAPIATQRKSSSSVFSAAVAMNSGAPRPKGTSQATNTGVNRFAGMPPLRRRAGGIASFAPRSPMSSRIGPNSRSLECDSSVSSVQHRTWTGNSSPRGLRLPNRFWVATTIGSSINW